MATEYDPHVHTYVTINYPDNPDITDVRDMRNDHDNWRGIFGIVLHTKEQVWVAASYSYEGHPDVKRVGDGRSNGYDEEGDCVLSIPASWCNYFTSDEADSIQALMDTDERLLSYM